MLIEFDDGVVLVDAADGAIAVLRVGDAVAGSSRGHEVSSMVSAAAPGNWHGPGPRECVASRQNGSRAPLRGQKTRRSRERHAQGAPAHVLTSRAAAS